MAFVLRASSPGVPGAGIDRCPSAPSESLSMSVNPVNHDIAAAREQMQIIEVKLSAKYPVEFRNFATTTPEHQQRLVEGFAASDDLKHWLCCKAALLAVRSMYRA
jgi:hypothetical protein